MSTHLGFGIARCASNQMLCEVCGEYVPWSCKAKNFGACNCPDLELRWQLLGAWKRVEHTPWNTPRRPYEPDYSKYMRHKRRDGEASFRAEVEARYLDLRGKSGRSAALCDVINQVCDEWNSRRISITEPRFASSEHSDWNPREDLPSF